MALRGANGLLKLGPARRCGSDRFRTCRAAQNLGLSLRAFLRPGERFGLALQNGSCLLKYAGQPRCVVTGQLQVSRRLHQFGSHGQKGLEPFPRLHNIPTSAIFGFPRPPQTFRMALCLLEMLPRLRNSCLTLSFGLWRRDLLEFPPHLPSPREVLLQLRRDPPQPGAALLKCRHLILKPFQRTIGLGSTGRRQVLAEVLSAARKRQVHAPTAGDRLDLAGDRGHQVPAGRAPGISILVKAGEPLPHPEQTGRSAIAGCLHDTRQPGLGVIGLLEELGILPDPDFTGAASRPTLFDAEGRTVDLHVNPDKGLATGMRGEAADLLVPGLPVLEEKRMQRVENSRLSTFIGCAQHVQPVADTADLHPLGEAANILKPDRTELHDASPFTIE